MDYGVKYVEVLIIATLETAAKVKEIAEPTSLQHFSVRPQGSITYKQQALRSRT